MPNVLLEAMAAGVPVVASNVSGVGELIRDRRTGHLVPAEDSEQLAARIIEVLDSEDQRKALAERAHRLVKDQYGVDRMLDNLEKVLVENHRHIRHKPIAAPSGPGRAAAFVPRKQIR
jgi:glycosyltransferase involved in cell wall biosynthesis